MKTSQKGLDLIKKYEGLRLTAYKAVPSEKYYTIGYGHYGKDVDPGMIITKEKAEEYLKSDLKSAEKAVDGLKRDFNQNQFDALVSFTYNCGSGNLRTLCKDRSIEEIGNKITAYNKSGGRVLNGLVKRRAEEQKLFRSNDQSAKETITTVKDPVSEPDKKDDSYKVKVSIKNLNIRKGPGTNYAKTGKFTGVGVFTIVETQSGIGSDKGWGRLKSGGWISLKFCEAIK